MPKRKHQSNSSKTIRCSNTSTTNIESDDYNNIAQNTNLPDEDFLDNTQMSLNKRKKHLENFYNRTTQVSG